MFHWVDQLKEAPNFKERVKKICTWDIEKLVELHKIDHHITRAVDLWVDMTL
jgi:hypothetical protein